MRNQGNSTWHLGPRTPSRAARVFLATEVEPSSAPSAHSCPSPGQREKLPTLITFSVPPPTPALSFPPPATLDFNNFFIYFPLHSPHYEHNGLLVIAPTCPESSCLRTFALLRGSSPSKQHSLFPCFLKSHLLRGI